MRGGLSDPENAVWNVLTRLLYRKRDASLFVDLMGGTRAKAHGLIVFKLDIILGTKVHFGTRCHVATSEKCSVFSYIPGEYIAMRVLESYQTEPLPQGLAEPVNNSTLSQR
jgi:hypothetical protein